MNTQNEPLVSVIMPVYNVREYIVESIKSICNQTYKNIELILINDGTKDDSVLIAKETLSDKKIYYKIINQENQGLPAARNTGIRNSSGEFICFIDSDDIISPNHIKNSIIALQKNGLDICFSNFEYTYIDKRKGSNESYFNYTILTQKELFKKFSRRKIAIHCCAIVFRKSFFEIKNVFFNPKLRYGEDVEFMWRVFSEVDKIAYVHQYSYKYLQRENSIMYTSSIEKWLIFRDEFKETINILIKKYPKNKETYKNVYARTLLGMLHIAALNCDKYTFKKIYEKLDIKSMSKRLIIMHEPNTIIAGLLINNITLTRKMLDR